jgi:hypothetical protein
MSLRKLISTAGLSVSLLIKGIVFLLFFSIHSSVFPTLVSCGATRHSETAANLFSKFNILKISRQERVTPEKLADVFLKSCVSEVVGNESRYLKETLIKLFNFSEGEQTGIDIIYLS